MTPSVFSEFMKLTKPGPSHPCSTCGTYSLRLYTEAANQEEKVVCTNSGCVASPFHRED